MSFVEKKQVYVICGFLESGKSQFIKYTLGQDYFQIDEESLLLVCEEGMEEYEDELLAEANTRMVVIHEEEEFCKEKLAKLDSEYNPERIVIEYNGIWSAKDISSKLPDNWQIGQQIVIVDGVTFETYFNNMRSLFADMIRGSELLIMNRCHQEEKLNGFKRSILGINPNISIVFENENGEVDVPITDEDLPYDVHADLIEIKDEDYGIFYLDLWQTPDRYNGKKFKVKTMVMKDPTMSKNFFAAGRPAMTCCADDIVYMGIMCKTKEARRLENKDTVMIIAEIKFEYRNEYGNEGPVLYAESVEKVEPMKNPMVSMV